MAFDWDEFKNRANFKKHQIWFEEAQTVWADEFAEELYDPDHSEEEERFLRIGYSTGDKLLLVSFTDREPDIIRIISARKLNKKERKEYER